MKSNGISWSSGVEASVEDGRRYNEEEDDGSYYAMRLDESVVLCEC